MTVVIYDSKSGQSANFIATMTFSKFLQLSHPNELIISSDLEFLMRNVCIAMISFDIDHLGVNGAIDYNGSQIRVYI